jgi:hypothetical protein
MTNAELNRDIKRFFKNYSIHLEADGSDTFFSWVDRYGRKEFLRLYGADKELILMNKKSILMLMKINRHLLIVPLHMMFINAEIEC